MIAENAKDKPKQELACVINVKKRTNADMQRSMIAGGLGLGVRKQNVNTHH
ncbi:hypothetical protein DEAC_c40320 [Desulfosporosinus acididurans]|uniref:Uncharacterized protein n=1 Tax=Desulfosporosinus acididurans TaxID=476652 RepID=A0A0J1FM65_9FIRM|nr:hypothetical protein [Desulfosporosinus acididurans]KLU64038.1 hypothetical protein DEAC_c40320 [Desulfosporosinus acididurans]